MIPPTTTIHTLLPTSGVSTGALQYISSKIMCHIYIEVRKKKGRCAYIRGIYIYNMINREVHSFRFEGRGLGIGGYIGYRVQSVMMGKRKTNAGAAVQQQQLYTVEPIVRTRYVHNNEQGQTNTSYSVPYTWYEVHIYGSTGTSAVRGVVALVMILRRTAVAAACIQL